MLHILVNVTNFEKASTVLVILQRYVKAVDSCNFFLPSSLEDMESCFPLFGQCLAKCVISPHILQQPP